MSTSELSGGTRQTAGGGGGRERGVTCHGLTSHPERSNYTFSSYESLEKPR